MRIFTYDKVIFSFFSRNEIFHKNNNAVLKETGIPMPYSLCHSAYCRFNKNTVASVTAENSMEVLQEIKDDHPAILFLAVYPKELKAES
jgi:hypothetical protein